ncbi:MAG: family peptidase [Ramlibacter sp.]|nr:family peptidase [Ramlibacter sp.]
MFQKLRLSLAAGLLLAAGSCLAAADDTLPALQAAYARAVTPGPQADQYRDLFATVLRRVERSYATEVDLPALVAASLKVVDPVTPGTGNPAEVFKRAINASLGTLDPYSRYLEGAERSDSSGRFGGLGLEVEASEGAVRVVSPISDSPAARAGLQTGDLIVRVDDAPLLGMPLADAIAMMRGQPGTQVSLTIRRAGVDNEITISLTRDTIRRQLLRSSMEGDVLVLRLGSFTGPVTAALQDAIAQATAAKAPSGVVLDLRGNPGGLLHEAVKVADTFLKQGQIVSIRGRTPSNQRTWTADSDELLEGVRLVVLIDRRSASASELVAAALQENQRAIVMGERSFGKGTVQSTMSLPGEIRGSLKLTTSLYYGPSGRSVQKAGVTPDIELVPSLQGRDDRRPAPAGEPQLAKARVEQGRCASQPTAAPDAVLSCALDYLRSGDLDDFIGRAGGVRLAARTTG